MRAINQPVSWWGWHWEPSVPMSVIELIRAGSLSPRLAAMFWIGMQRGASLIVAADPPSAGKTTTLTALMSLAPPDTLVYFTRGLGEPFALPARTNSHPTYMLINEMSDHLPVYTWDDNARRAFELLAQGYCLATTMHDDTLEGVLGQLEGDLGIPRRQIANLTFVVTLHVGHGGSGRRGVREVTFLRPSGDDLIAATIARWDSQRDEFEVLPEATQRGAFAAWGGLSEDALEADLAQREAFLHRLLDEGTASIPEVTAAIELYYENVIRRRPGA